MHLRQIIAAPKVSVKVGTWRTGKVPKADFPVGRTALRFGSTFHWCVVTFRALDTEMRVLIVFHPGKQVCQATLGVMAVDGALRIACVQEYHATHPGWHVHATCDPITQLPAGIFRGPWVRRFPGGRQHHRRKVFGLRDTAAALRFALARYRIDEKGPLL